MLENFPNDTQRGRRVELDMHCEKCGHGWSAISWDEFGDCSLIDEKDAKCPQCGAWSQ